MNNVSQTEPEIKENFVQTYLIISSLLLTGTQNTGLGDKSLWTLRIQ